MILLVNGRASAAQGTVLHAWHSSDCALGRSAGLVVRVGGLAAHAEEFRPGGEVLHGDSPDVAVRYAQVFGWLMAGLAGVTAYQDLRERSFTAAEQEVAWAASLWTAAYNAREEALHGRTAVSGDALRAQAAERLRRAGT
jgi:hypothetical protein